MTELEKQGAAAKEAARTLAVLSTKEKNDALLAIKIEIESRKSEWLSANAEDVYKARERGMRESLLDRLT